MRMGRACSAPKRPNVLAMRLRCESRRASFRAVMSWGTASRPIWVRACSARRGTSSPSSAKVLISSRTTTLLSSGTWPNVASDWAATGRVSGYGLRNPRGSTRIVCSEGIWPSAQVACMRTDASESVMAAPRAGIAHSWRNRPRVKAARRRASASGARLRATKCCLTCSLAIPAMATAAPCQ